MATWGRAKELLILLQEASCVEPEWFEVDEICEHCKSGGLSLVDFLELLDSYVNMPDYSDESDPNYMDRAFRINDDTQIRLRDDIPSQFEDEDGESDRE